MRLILHDVDADVRLGFRPLSLGRPIWDLRCGMFSLGCRLIARVGAGDVAYFVPDYMADAYRTKVDCPVNDSSVLRGEDLLLIPGQVKAEGFDVPVSGPSEVGLDESGNVLYVRVARDDLKRLPTAGIQEFLAAAKLSLPAVQCSLEVWKYIWDLVLANPDQIAADFAAEGRSGIEGVIEQPNAVRGGEKDVYVAPGARLHPMVVIDASDGPVYIDRDAVIHPFTRIEGPCYIGKESILFGAKCREGNSIGPVCRVGGELEGSIIQGYSNKYHDGFLGHAYVGQWVNLGAFTTNSDLKNDYSSVSMTLDGRRPIDTGSIKVGSVIGDHAKTSIGTLLNSGSYVGAMALILGTGKPLEKYIPSFSWYLGGVVTKGFGKKRLYETAKTTMGRRKCEWTTAEEAMWNAVFEMTAPVRNQAIKKGRKVMLRSQ
ncbi:MAG: putative sugar nucleotidyl transferase [Phycisphaerae bacterium]|nr:putative sugar nucleotidyl transferase [Phycisphaerae bacterium]